MEIINNKLVQMIVLSLNVRDSTAYKYPLYRSIDMPNSDNFNAYDDVV